MAEVSKYAVVRLGKYCPGIRDLGSFFNSATESLVAFKQITWFLCVSVTSLSPQQDTYLPSSYRAALFNMVATRHKALFKFN